MKFFITFALLLVVTAARVLPPAPIESGPVVIDFPLPDGGAVTAQPSPVVTAPTLPLVQIIISTKPNVPGSPVVVETVRPPAPTPVQVVEAPAEPEPVIVVDKPIAAPIVVPDPIIPPEAVIVAEPIIVAPVVLPDPLN